MNGTDLRKRRQEIIKTMVQMSPVQSNKLKFLWGELRECEKRLLELCAQRTEELYEARELLRFGQPNPSAEITLGAERFSHLPSETTESYIGNLSKLQNQLLNGLIRALEEREQIDPCDYPALETNSEPIRLALRSLGLSLPETITF
jgi:hypothetical protein